MRLPLLSYAPLELSLTLAIFRYLPKPLHDALRLHRRCRDYRRRLDFLYPGYHRRRGRLTHLVSLRCTIGALAIFIARVPLSTISLCLLLSSAPVNALIACLRLFLHQRLLGRLFW